MDELLTPAQKKAFGSVLNTCNRCRPLLELIEAAGGDTADEKARLEHLQGLAEAALELNTQFKLASGK